VRGILQPAMTEHPVYVMLIYTFFSFLTGLLGATTRLGYVPRGLICITDPISYAFIAAISMPDPSVSLDLPMALPRPLKLHAHVWDICTAIYEMDAHV
jgi:hypothetical protein